ncbi:hypothetical protein LC048_24555 [Mesobacillus subterraneus]|uniref:hypothetical protein n=1 Tax=Mesobacillus subterraneus TaxID=285983 RepID=UPI001CFDFA93|nr:hypothetical protein [Mesobacillus subterraneus]WLR55395.1 hypothetical protein LC048_24555 [Mesobacillus subterraneus]
MGFISGKLLAGLTAGALTVSGVAYTGGQYLDDIKANIDAVKEKAALMHDEAYTKAQIANEFVNQKNAEIDRLEAGYDALEDELEKANLEITEGQAGLDAKDADLQEANADMTALNTYSAAAVATVNSLPDLGGIADSDSVVKGNELVISLVSSQTIEKKYKVVNKNGVAITGTHNGEAFTVPAGDVIYVANKSGADTFIYNLDTPNGGVTTITKKKTD